MFYKYCGMSGKVIPSSQLAAYQPTGLTPFSGSTSSYVFDSVKTHPIRQSAVSTAPASARAASTSTPLQSKAPTSEPIKVPTSGSGNKGMVPNTAAYRRLMELQNLFMRDDGKLVWQKLGRDRVTYLVTLGLLAVGGILSVNLIYVMAFTKKE